MFDATSQIAPKGGINKDSGYYILSPHAHLHQIASRLAIEHTEHFFDEIRTVIGDKEFAKFLQLKKTRHSFTNIINQHIQVCSSARFTYSYITFIAFVILKCIFIF